MKKLLLLAVGVIVGVQMAFATICPDALPIPTTPTFPYSQPLTCGAGNDINAGNSATCATANYLGGQEAVYVWTPTEFNYSGVTIQYTGQTWSGIFIYAGCPTSGGACIAAIGSSTSAKTLNVPGILAAGTTYYIVFDTWPTPNSPCAGTFTINGTINSPATPPAPVQDPGAPTCLGGSQLTVTGTPPTDVTWYWQTSATGTSTANNASSPNTVFANGTYYVRAHHAPTNTWSTASSVVVSNFPTATMPPAPIAAVNPACVTTGTTISVAAAPVGTVYYWQGTTANGSSTAQNAATPYPVAATGTYHVAAYETATGCWSNTSSLLVTVDTYVPAAPTADPDNFNICSMTPSFQISANASGGPGSTPDTVTVNSGAISVGIPDASVTGASHTLVVNTVPAGAVVVGLQVTINMTHTWDADVDIALTGPNGTQIDLCSDNGGSGDNFVNTVFSNTAVNPITGGVAPFTGTYLPEGSLASLFSIPNGNWTLFMADDAGGDVGTLTNWSVRVIYENALSTIAWYDAATGGTNIGNGVPFETVGTTVMPNTNSEGTFTFHAAAASGGCVSTTTIPITVNVTEVLAALNPVNVTCHGGSNGSFTLGAIQCGTEPFTYSVNGGPFGPIPTNLVADTHSVVIQDGAGQSAPIELIITEPDVPQDLTAFNVNYFNAQVTWTAQGDETSWTVIYGPVGFDPLTEGVTEIAMNDTLTIDTLTEDTEYEFYVYANCGSEGMAGPEPFTTNPGFFTYDSDCGPGFNDISATGDLVDFSTDPDFLVDDREAGVTLPFPISYQGTTVNDISIGMNGGVVLGTLTGEVGYAFGPNGTPALFPYVQDLNTHDVFTQTVGTAPNRQFIIQWENATPYSFTPLTDGVTFQVVLNESAPDIYFLYEDLIMGGAANDYGANAEIGVRGPVDINVSVNSPTYLTNNQCIHFYPALCPNPVNIVVTPFEEEAQITWDAGLYGETEWTVIYGAPGFDPATEGTTQVVSIPPDPDAQILIGGLTENTEYEVYIYSECAADDLTSGGVMVSFITKPYCSNPTALTAQTDVDSLEAAWNWAVNPMYPEATIDGFNLQYGPTGFELGTGTIYGADGTLADTVYNADFIAGGVYQVYVQAACGVDTVSAWVGPVTFIMPLSNDDPCGAQMLEVDGTVYTLNNAGATVATGENAIAPPAEGAQETTGWTNSTLNNTTWFTFVAPGSGNVRVNSTAINYNGQSAVYFVTDCANYGAFAMIAANDNEIGGTSVAPNYTICGLNPGETYYLLADGFNATTGNYSISISEIVMEAGIVGEVANICAGSDVDLFTTISGYGAGGVWTSADDIAAVDASINGSNFTSEGLAYQLFDFEYRVTDGCAYDSIISQVEVFAPSSAGDDGSITACRNEPIDLLAGLNGSADLGGTWYDPSQNELPNSQISTGNFPGSFNYDYIAGNGVCPDDTAVVVVNIGTCDFLEVDETLFEGVQVYPNPTKGTIFISSDVSEAFDYVVTDAKGRVIAQKEGAVNASEITEINLSAAETGVYFIRLSNENTAKTYRVVVQP